MRIFKDNVATPESIQKDQKGEPKKVTHNGNEYVLVEKKTEKGSKFLSYLKVCALSAAILYSLGIVTLFDKFRTLIQDNLSILRSGERKVLIYNLLNAKKEEKPAEKTAEKAAAVAVAAS